MKIASFSFSLHSFWRFERSPCRLSFPPFCQLGLLLYPFHTFFNDEEDGVTSPLDSHLGAGVSFAHFLFFFPPSLAEKVFRRDPLFPNIWLPISLCPLWHLLFFPPLSVHRDSKRKADCNPLFILPPLFPYEDVSPKLPVSSLSSLPPCLRD